MNFHILKDYHTLTRPFYAFMSLRAGSFKYGLKKKMGQGTNFLYEKHQASFSAMVDSNHVPNTLVKKDLSASNNFKMNIANEMAGYKNKKKEKPNLQRLYETQHTNLLIFQTFKLL